jgi:hypothetical protein
MAAATDRRCADRHSSATEFCAQLLVFARGNMTPYRASPPFQMAHWTDAKIPDGFHTHMAPSVRMEAPPL